MTGARLGGIAFESFILRLYWSWHVITATRENTTFA